MRVNLVVLVEFCWLLRLCFLSLLVLVTPPSFSEQRGWFESLFSSEPQSQSERLLETYGGNRTEILDEEVYSQDGFIFFAYREEVTSEDELEMDLEWRLTNDGMLAVSDLMDGLVMEACGKINSSIELPSASVPEQGIIDGYYVYVLAAPKEELDLQIDRICSP